VSEAELPLVTGMGDVFAMACRNRWAGLEQEGFGIVFVEAAACGVPAVAGRSGGAHEAVADGETGHVVEPRDTDAVRTAISALLADEEARQKTGAAARERAEAEFDYDVLTPRLAALARGDVAGLPTLPLYAARR
jgi:phosphatidylinositol alpha-1,6-mannosyltransferase